MSTLFWDVTTLFFYIVLYFWDKYDMIQKEDKKMSERSERILRAIKESNLSYGEISNITSIPKSALQRYATGETDKIPIERIELIAKATGVTSEYLMGWVQNSQDERFSPESALLSAKVAKNPELKELVSIYLSLNDTGRKKLIDNALDLIRIYSDKKDT